MTWLFTVRRLDSRSDRSDRDKDCRLQAAIANYDNIILLFSYRRLGMGFTSRYGVLIGILGLALVGQEAWAVPTTRPVAPSMVQRGKRATARLEISEAGRPAYASAFCIDPSGIFVTSAHAVTRLTSRNIKLVLYPSEADQKVVDATVVRTEPASDLALLRLEKPQSLSVLELGNDESLLETAPVTAFGYPFGTGLALRTEDYPSITVSTGRITSLRKVKGALQAIQLDASLNPGNSGGPVLDESGRVVGVVAMGIVGSGVNFAVPVSKVRQLLLKPDISFIAPPVPLARQSEEREFTIRARMFLQKHRPEVFLVLNPGQPGERTFAAKADGDVYKVSAAPVPPRKGPKNLRIKAEFSGGTLIGRGLDRPVKVGNQEVKLSEIDRIQRAEKTVVTLSGGKQLEGAISGVEDVELTLGELSLNANLAKAARVFV
jgi:S1-C subfamily serine protease